MSNTTQSFSKGDETFLHTCTNSSCTKKVREHKGSSVNQHIDDYCVIDLETTSVFISSASIVEISAIKVRNNNIVSEFSTLINPNCVIPQEATLVNHITNEMVRNSPTIDEVIYDFLNFVGDDVVVGYNISGFDINIIYDIVKATTGNCFGNDYLDIYHAVKRSLSLDNSRLETVCKYYQLDTTNEHRALSDCYLTNIIYRNLYNDFGDKAFQKSSDSHHYSNGVHYSVETLALQELQNLSKFVLEDNVISIDEIGLIHFWLEDHRYLENAYPFNRVINALDNILEDGQISKEEQDELKALFKEIIDPINAQKCSETITSLFNKQVCLSGEFDFGSKSDVEELIINAGGIVEKNIKKTINYLVVGSKGSSTWKTDNYGGKIQKATELNSKGSNIIIIKEEEFIPAVQRLIDHPNKCECNENSPLEYDWKKPIEAMLDEYIDREELPKNSILLCPNYDRNGDNVVSYSICINEPDYPATQSATKDAVANPIGLNIRQNGQSLELIVEKNRFGILGVPKGAIIKETESDKTNVHILMPIESNTLAEYVEKNVEYAYMHYSSKAMSFGCCSKYVECSDVKKCIHENKLYSKACMYRKNLESGKIFYGKNKNN